MTGWIFAAITCFVYIMQTTLFGNLAVFGVSPDAVLVCVICYSMIFGREKGFIAAFVVGILMDFLTGLGFGRNLTVYLLSSALASVLAENTFGKNFLTAALITFIVSVAGGVGMSAYMYIAKLNRDIIYSIFITTLLYALCNMIVGVFIFILIENLKKFSYRME